MADQEAPAYEHARRERARWPTAGLDWNGWRVGRPLIGGLVGFGVVVLFLAVRGGDTDAGDPLTGTVRGGWSNLIAYDGPTVAVEEALDNVSLVTW